MFIHAGCVPVPLTLTMTRSLAVERVARDPQILEEQQELAFHLQQQRLIELIREGRVDDALEFAQENLAPLGEEQPALLEELGEPWALKPTRSPPVHPLGSVVDTKSNTLLGGKGAAGGGEGARCAQHREPGAEPSTKPWH